MGAASEAAHVGVSGVSSALPGGRGAGTAIAPPVNRGARHGSMVCDGSMNAQTLERPVLDEPQLNAANRCDACGARAWVRATMPSGGQLYFCGHHANEHLPSLVGAGAQILDERHFMND